MARTLRLDAGSKSAALKKAVESLSDDDWDAVRVTGSHERGAGSPDEEATTVWHIEVS